MRRLHPTCLRGPCTVCRSCFATRCRKRSSLPTLAATRPPLRSLSPHSRTQAGWGKHPFPLQQRRAFPAPAEKRATVIAVPAAEKLSLIRPEFINTQPFELGGECNMEALNGKLWGATNESIEPSLPFAISGWGADAKQGIAPTEVYLRLQNAKNQEFYAPAPIVHRGDLREYFGKAFYEKSGYTVTVDAQALPPGEYQAMIVMNVDGRTMLCASGRKLILEGGKK